MADTPQETQGVPRENVVPLRVALPPQENGPRRVKRRRPPYNECEHKLVEIDEKHRVLTCRTCERQVDPFYFLGLLANEEAQLDYRYKALAEFKDKERQREQKKHDDCKAARHPIYRNRNCCRCGTLTRWQMEHDPESVRKAMPDPAPSSAEAPRG